MFYSNIGYRVEMMISCFKVTIRNLIRSHL